MGSWGGPHHRRLDPIAHPPSPLPPSPSPPWERPSLPQHDTTPSSSVPTPPVLVVSPPMHPPSPTPVPSPPVITPPTPVRRRDPHRSGGLMGRAAVDSLSAYKFPPTATTPALIVSPPPDEHQMFSSARRDTIIGLPLDPAERCGTGREEQRNGGRSRLQRALVAVTTSCAFRRGVEVLVTASIVLLTCDVAGGRSSHRTLFLSLDACVAALFVIECAAKVGSNGLAGTPDSYLACPWNRLDLAVLLAGLVALTSEGMLAVRAIRPLRLLRFWGMPKMVRPVVKSVVGMATPGLLLLFVLGVLGLVGVYVLGGRYHDPSSPLTGFDNLPKATLLVFQVVTFDDWPQVVDRAQESVGWWVWTYFAVAVLAGSFFCVNLMLAVLVREYHKAEGDEALASLQREERCLGTTPCTTSVQQRMLYLRRMSRSLPPLPPPKRSWIDTTPSAVRGIRVVVLMNAVALMLNHRGAPEWLDTTILVVNYAATAILFLEFVLRLGGEGRDYFATVERTSLGLTLQHTIHYANCLDAAISVSSIAEIALRGVSVLGIFRLHRVVRIVHSDLVDTLSASVPAVLSLVCVMGVVLLVFSIAAYHLLDFPSLSDAALAGFMVLTGESWAAVMQQAAPVGAAVPGFLCLFILGHFVLVKLFIAVSVEEALRLQAAHHLEGIESDDESVVSMHPPDLALDVLKGGHTDHYYDDDACTLTTVPAGTPGKIATPRTPLSIGSYRTPVSPSMRGSPARTPLGSPVVPVPVPTPVLRVPKVLCKSPAQEGLHKALASFRFARDESPEQGCLSTAFPCIRCDTACGDDDCHDSPYDRTRRMSIVPLTRNTKRRRGVLMQKGMSWALPRSSSLKVKLEEATSPLPVTGAANAGSMRVAAAVVVGSKAYRGVMTAVVAANCAVLATQCIEDWTAAVFTAFYTVDLCVKVAARGARGAVVEGILTAVSLASVWVRVLRVVGAVRSLGVVTGGVYGVLLGLRTSVVPIASVMAVVLVIAVCWAVVGVGLFKDRVDDFGNLPSAALAIFVISLGEGWQGIMDRAVQATSPAAAVYFVGVVVVVGMFALNLFVSTVLCAFSQFAKAQVAAMLGEAGLPVSPAQQRWVRVERLIHRLRLVQRPQPVHHSCHRVVQSTWFSRGVVATILANCAVMATFHANQSPEYDALQHYSNIVFVVLYTAEAVVKALAYSARHYLTHTRFEAGVVIVSWVTVFFPTVQYLQILNVGRAFRLLTHLNHILLTLLYALPALSNIAAVLVLFYFLAGLLGMSLFSGIPLQGNPGLSHNRNFDTLPNAMVTLFQISTTEGWVEVMDGCSHTAGCAAEGRCGDRAVATGYFVTFMVVGSLVLLQLFVMVVLTEFNAQMDDDNDNDIDDNDSDDGEIGGGERRLLRVGGSIAVKVSVLECLRDGWGVLDAHGSGKLPAKSAVTLIRWMVVMLESFVAAQQLTVNTMVKQGRVLAKKHPVTGTPVTHLTGVVWVRTFDNTTVRLLASSCIPQEEAQCVHRVTSFATILPLLSHLPIPVDAKGEVRYDDTIHAVGRYLFDVSATYANSLVRAGAVRTPQWCGTECLMLSQYTAARRLETAFLSFLQKRRKGGQHLSTNNN